MTGQNGLSSSFVETVAGFTAGIVSTLCVHPLDLIKTRLQGKLHPYQILDIPRTLSDSFTFTVDRTSSSIRFGSSLRIFRDILKHEGGYAAFYRGLAPNLIGNSTSWGLYFLCYGGLKDAFRMYRGQEEWMLTSSDFFLASGAAGMQFPPKTKAPFSHEHGQVQSHPF